MRYYNQNGERVDPDTLNIDYPLPRVVVNNIIGWAINIDDITSNEITEFLKLYKKINPTPLYSKKEQ